MRLGNDPEGERLPIKVDSTSNGEFEPVPLDARQREGNRLARLEAAKNAKRLGMGRRAFLVSMCGAASTLLAFNAVNAAAGRRGGSFELAAEAAVEPEAAAEALGGQEFIFDVQGHFIGEAALRPGSPRGPRNFIKDVFLDSDTDMMVLSFVPSRRDSEPLTIREADAVRQIVDDLEGSQRLLLHGRVNPNQQGDVEGMDELAERWGVSAWKTYTQWGPNGRGYFLSDPDTGIPFIEKARDLGVKVICIHKGIPFGGRSYEHSLCDDVGVVARQFPDVSFVIYHSGWVPGQAERAYQHDAKRDGADSLVRSLLDNGVPPNSNVYAELGSTWRGVMGDPDNAAHCLGKLLKYVGEDNVLWGRLDLVRLAAGPDPGLSQLPDRTRAAGAPWLSGYHTLAARQGLRSQRHPAVPDQRRGGAETSRQRRHCRTPPCLCRESRPALPDLRSANPT